MKKVKWACIYQELEFDSDEEANEYFKTLRGGYILCARDRIEGDRVKVVIARQYNNSPLPPPELNRR